MNRYASIAEYYDPENDRLRMLREDVPFFLRQQPKGKRLSVLELCTGTGRAAIPIAQAGYRVVGVERDPAMLGIAVRKRDSVGLRDRELELIRGDVLKLDDLEWNWGSRKFDRVCIFFNTLLAFTTLEMQDKLLARVRSHLKRTGRFWIDIFHPDHGMLAERESKKMETSSFYVPALERTVVLTIDVKRDMSRQWMQVTFNYLWYDGHGVEKREKASFEMTAIFPRELTLLLERNGFVVDELWGDYDGSKLTADSPRMIASCRLA